jgi:hypothetical protein
MKIVMRPLIRIESDPLLAALMAICQFGRKFRVPRCTDSNGLERPEENRPDAHSACVDQILCSYTSGTAERGEPRDM